MRLMSASARGSCRPGQKGGKTRASPRPAFLGSAYRARALLADGNANFTGREGFTLAEALVAIAIIALLLAILLPALDGAREQARRAVCLSNLKRIAAAWQLYLDDNQGRFLQRVNADLAYGGKQGSGSSFRRAKPLNRYLGLPAVTADGAAIFGCPSDAGGPGAKPTCFDYYGTSYMMNPLLVGQNQIGDISDPAHPCTEPLMREINQRLKRLSSNRIGFASKLLLMGDFPWKDNWYHGVRHSTGWHRRPCSHNAGFMDGHAAFVRIGKGLHVTRDYTVIPFRDLQSRAAACQGCTEPAACCDTCMDGRACSAG